MTSPTKSLTCKLTTPELQHRKATVIAELKSLITSRQELHNGYEYTFNSTDQNFDKLIEFIKNERLCCDFFRFQLVVEGDSAVLTIIGPEGAKEFLENEVGL